MASIRPYEIGKQLCEALGLDPVKTDKIVLVFDVRDVLRVYVRQIVQKTETDALLSTLANAVKNPADVKIEQVEEATVADDCTVRTVPVK
jgi:hypothetical protein